VLPLRRVGKFYPDVVLTTVRTPVKTKLGKTPKKHNGQNPQKTQWAKPPKNTMGKTNFLNSENVACQESPLRAGAATTPVRFS